MNPCQTNSFLVHGHVKLKRLEKELISKADYTRLLAQDMVDNNEWQQFKVKKVLEQQWNKDIESFEFKVRWKGYSSDYDSREPNDAMEHIFVINEYKVTK